MNVHGRRAGRGWRPWLLLPKVLAAGLCFGASVAGLVIWLRGDWVGSDTAQRLALLASLRSLFLLLIIPSLVATMVFGGLLILEGGRVLLRLRWLQVKLGLVLVGTPLLHLFMASRMQQLRQATHAEQATHAAAGQFTLGFVLLIIWLGLLIVLGRLKPRLGQNWARDYRKSSVTTARDAV